MQALPNLYTFDNTGIRGNISHLVIEVASDLFNAMPALDGSGLDWDPNAPHRVTVR